ncbi:uncharacterized domain 1-containing protein [Flexibacter flexilis DSM 6793]|uniref:Uncharacterized domain 1-containing protein n=1 Tax=Flexibacter flexilis DSM 6793 TaxID=927664 RepID=A0A1I1GRG9_9BACT|nr:PaaI family thioesterase [Flexibacter flexilis]SFC14244.1 uncharacterized domain 1-containing protein [Flexibacter flexilis DSM 6793]
MIKALNPDFKAAVEAKLGGQHFMHLFGFKLTTIEEGRTEGWLDINKNHQQNIGFLHGGLVATMADIVAGFAASTLVPANYHVVTGEIKISYLNPGIGQKAHAIGWVLKQGRRMHFCEAEVWCINNGERKMVAKASATMVVIPPQGETK